MPNNVSNARIRKNNIERILAVMNKHDTMNITDIARATSSDRKTVYKIIIDVLIPKGLVMVRSRRKYTSVNSKVYKEREQYRQLIAQIKSDDQQFLEAMKPKIARMCEALEIANYPKELIANRVVRDIHKMAQGFSRKQIWNLIPLEYKTV
jgi:predicted transcriptional regulator